MLNPTLNDGPKEIALMSDLQRLIVWHVYQSGGDGLRLWQLQKKVGDALEELIKDALMELLAAGYVEIISMGGGPKYYRIHSKMYIMDALSAHQKD